MKTFPNKNTFRKWLLSKDFSSIIAEDWSCYSCPLANFIKDKYKYESVYISPNIGEGTNSVWRYSIIFGEDCSGLIKMPIWAEKFAHEVDKANPISKGLSYMYPAITAGHCLKILEEVK